jgi:hypothetical protein
MHKTIIVQLKYYLCPKLQLQDNYRRRILYMQAVTLRATQLKDKTIIYNNTRWVLIL